MEVAIETGRSGPYDVYKILLSAALSMLLTGLVAWFAFGRDTLNRSEMERFTERQSQVNSALTGQIQGLLIEQAKLGAKVDQVLIELGQIRQEQRKGRGGP